MEYRDRIVKYLEGAVSLEQEIFTQQMIMESLDEEIGGLAIRKTIYLEQEIPAKFGDCTEKFIKWPVVIGALFGMLIGFSNSSGFSMFFSGVGTAFAGMAIGVVIGFIISLIAYKSECDDVRCANELHQRKYNNALQQDQERVARELEQVVRLQELHQLVAEKQQQTLSVLRDYYKQGPLHPKYYNIIAVSSFFDYFDSRRCTELEGNGGAYDKFEFERRQDILINKMDMVLEKLDQIRENQYMLYSAICEGNRIQQKLVDEAVKQTRLQEYTAEKSAITAYNSQCLLEEQRWSNYVQTVDLMIR